MIGIFLRWRQLGRRYFWPHILLGMVAASFGMPACAQNSEPASAAEPASSSLFVGRVLQFDYLIRLQETARRPNFSIDYWHQHAIRTVIRHLSFTLSPATEIQPEHQLPLAAQKLALIDSLQALLTVHHQPWPEATTFTAFSAPAVSHTVVGWHAKVHGIRAGPAATLV